MQSVKCLVFCWLHADDGTPKGIGSLDALAGLQNLEMLYAKNAGITDVSAFADLPKLWEIQLNDNEIIDVTPACACEKSQVAVTCRKSSYRL